MLWEAKNDEVIILSKALSEFCIKLATKHERIRRSKLKNKEKIADADLPIIVRKLWNTLEIYCGREYLWEIF